MPKEVQEKEKRSFFARLAGLRKQLEEEEIEEEELYEEPKEEKLEETEESKKETEEKGGEEWLEENYEGQLAVDVYQTPQAIVIKSTIAGVKEEDLDITLNNDQITIRGVRRKDEMVPEEDYFFQECYWGGFSRTIILPVDVIPEKAEATLENGILTIILPKAPRDKTVSIKIKSKK